MQNALNLMNDEESVSVKHLKLKYRRGDQIIETSCKIAWPRNEVHPL